MEDFAASHPPPELDPFCLPQETRGRFWMFMAAAIAFTWSLGAWWVEVPNIYTLNWWAEPELQEHFEQLKTSMEWTSIKPESIALFRQSRIFRQSLEYFKFQLGRILISFGIAVVTGLLAVVLYLLHPIILARRYQVISLETPMAEEETSRLSVIAGIAPPRISLKPGLLDGLAFGRKGKEILALGGQRVLLARRWTAHIRAVALHEMAHIANGDIRTRVGSSSLWIALAAMLALVGALTIGTSLLLTGKGRIPVFRLSFVPAETETFLAASGAMLARSLLLLLAVWWLWSELIRAREFYADARVATWGFRKPLLETLRLGEANSGRRSFGRRHPPHTVRIEHLEHPEKLFHTSRRLAFLTGLLLTLLSAQMTPFSTDLTFIMVCVCTPLVFLLGPLAILVLPIVFFGVLCLLAYLVTGALGTQVQRQTIAELATTPHHQWGYLRLIKTAFFFALGLEAGLVLSPFNTFGFGKTALWVSAWLLILTFLVWLWLVFLKGTTRFLLGGSQAKAQGTRRWLNLLSTAILAALLGSALVFRLTIEAGYHFDRVSSLTPPGTDPVEFFMVMFLMTSFFLLGGALALYIGLGFLTGLAAIRRVFLCGAKCPHCADPAPSLLLVGRRCRACGTLLAPWPFLGESS